MRSNKLLWPIFISLIIQSNSVNAFNYSQCNKLSNRLNEGTPMHVDAATFVKGTFCSDTKPKPTINYVMITTLNTLDISAMTNFQKNYWCSDPGQKKLLNVADVKYQYHTKSGVYLGATNLSIRMCS